MQSTTVQPIASKIWSAINKQAPRDWTSEEKKFISFAPSLKENLLRLYAQPSSDGCWTDANITFLRGRN